MPCGLVYWPSWIVRTTRLAGTSITVSVEVYVQRNPEKVETVKVTEATLTYVAVDKQGRPRVVSVQH